MEDELKRSNTGRTVWKALLSVTTAMVVFAGCGPTSQHSHTLPERRPCDELQEVQKEYEQIKSDPETDEDDLRSLRYTLHKLRIDCEQYNERVKRYRSEFDLTEEDAKERAASGGSVIDRTPVRPASLLGHGTVPRDAIYAEILGQSFGLTVNYEHKLFDIQPHNLALRGGFGGFLFWVSIPVSINYLFGYNHKLELAAGWLYMSGDLGSREWGGEFSHHGATGFAGYRYESSGGGTLFRAGFVLFGWNARSGDFSAGIFPGISLGYAW